MAVPTRKRIAALLTLLLGVAGLSVALLASSAASAPDLPAVQARSLVASALRAAASGGPVAGDVDLHVDLGLPQLADAGGAPELSGVTGALESLSGDHHLRVWASTDGLRAAELTQFAERSLFVSPSGAWAWDSNRYTAYRLASLPHAHIPQSQGLPRSTGDLGPEQLAARMLAAVRPTTRVVVARTATVAGRAAYVLALQPRTSETLIGHIDVAVDAATRVPLGVYVYPRRSSTPAMSSAFTSVGFGPIAPSTFRFTPPPGAKVVTAQSKGSDAPQDATAPSHPTARLAQRVRSFGSGWTGIVALRVSPKQVGRAGGGTLSKLLPFSGPLFSMRLAERSGYAWLIVGMVPQEALARVQARLP